MRCSDECGKKWKMKQMKSGCQKQKKKEQKNEKMQKEKRKEFRKLIVEEEMEIVRMIEENRKKREI